MIWIVALCPGAMNWDTWELGRFFGPCPGAMPHSPSPRDIPNGLPSLVLLELVVPVPLDIFADQAGELFERHAGQVPALEEVALERAEEPLGARVVGAPGPPRHRAHHPGAARLAPLAPHADGGAVGLHRERPLLRRDGYPHQVPSWIGNTYLEDSGRDSPASLNSTADM